MEIIKGQLHSSDLTRNARGGSELMLMRLYDSLPAALLEKFHIVNSRLESSLDHDLHKVFIAHDLAGDPATDFLRNGGWQVFDKLVFVSHWQMETFQQMYGIAPSRCAVLHNAIQPITPNKGLYDEIRIGYWSTPHRGLSILVPVFEYLATKYPEIRLDVFSSFNLYGWGERDSPYQPIFDKCIAHPQINYHGSVSNNEVRLYASEADIFAYPSIWPETSCLCLMEAMSAGMICVHSNLAALPETSANWTQMYQYNEEINDHARMFHIHLEKAIAQVKNNRSLHYTKELSPRLQAQKEYTDMFYNWNFRRFEWKQLLEEIVEPT